MEELIKELSINKPGEYEDDAYVVPLESYDEMSVVYNQLEQADSILKNSDESYFNMDEAHVVYISKKDDYMVYLDGDLKDDIYTLVVKEVK